jgi:alpha-ribazole phosphatase/probable phosphoglycerate mutase
MLNVYLLRHGETQWNADGNRYCGRTDIALTKKGISQAELAHDQLKHISFDAVYSSPLQRARHTAQIASGKKDVITDERLIEFSFGNWEGKTKEEFIAEDPALWDRWSNDPGSTKAGGTGETANEVVTRVNNFFEFLLKKIPAGNVLVVGHNGINRFYLAFKLSMQLKNYRRLVQQNSSITMFTLNPQNEELSLQLLNSLLTSPNKL